MFLDEATIDVAAGNGGRGCVSWRREKYVPKGGPDGGDGGAGGNVVFLADANTDTLSAYASRKHFEAEKGHAGRGKNMRGKDGEDVVLVVPPGTMIYGVGENGDDTLLADLQESGDRIIVAYGGRGGYGNGHFATSVRQRPDFAELGEPGEQRKIRLELKLVADVGIIGFPSVGKSTLISVISNAKPKIGDYPFTTLVPNLGVVHVFDRSFVVCDVPGLIEGASEGKGLGDTFLRHIERCGVLVHMLDCSRALGVDGTIDAEKLLSDYRIIRSELSRFSPLLAEKRELVVLAKIDLLHEGLDALIKTLESHSVPIFASISSATRKGTDTLCQDLLPIALEEKERRLHQDAAVDASAPLPVLKPQEESDRMGAYRVEKEQDGTVRVRGKRLEQFTKMTDFSSRGGLDRFRDVLKRIGVLKAIAQTKPDEDARIYIGDIPIDSYL